MRSHIRRKMDLLCKITFQNKHRIQTFGLPTMPTLDNTRERIISVLFSHAFVASCNSHDKLKRILDKIGGRTDKIKLDDDLANSHEMPRFNDLTKISLGMRISVDNTPLLKRLRR